MQNAIISTKWQSKSFVHFYVFFFQEQVPKYGEIWGYGVQNSHHLKLWSSVKWTTVICDQRCSSLVSKRYYSLQLCKNNNNNNKNNNTPKKTHQPKQENYNFKACYLLPTVSQMPLPVTCKSSKELVEAGLKISSWFFSSCN